MVMKANGMEVGRDEPLNHNNSSYSQPTHRVYTCIVVAGLRLGLVSAEILQQHEPE